MSSPAHSDWRKELAEFRGWLRRKRLPKGESVQPTGLGRHYPRLAGMPRLERMLRAFELRLERYSFGHIAHDLGVSRSTALRLVREASRRLYPTEQDRKDAARARLCKRSRGRPRKDDMLVPDRVLYKCHQMAACLRAGNCLDGNPIAWGSPEMPCSRRIVKSWKPRDPA